MDQSKANELDTGWSYIDAPEPGLASDYANADEIPMIFARCFQTDEGAIALKHLRRITLERVIDPSASDSMLRHAEGQRHLVKMIDSLVARGRKSRSGVLPDPS
ncbi:MAG: hypothetical protein IPM60_02025 [Rhodospirillales bacterium]|nr:hypothetical protein [Rhodospirillales bacterium]